MTTPVRSYISYITGHLIHFEADLTMMNLEKTMTGYFYSCQFPNTVFKMLNCYKCQESKKMTKICGLGAEVKIVIVIIIIIIIIIIISIVP